MGLKEPKKYRQIVWLTPEQNKTLVEFIQKLDHEWPANSAISSALYIALRDSDVSARIKAAMDRERGVQKGTGIRKVCEFCGTYCMSDKHRIDHERTCKKRPLVMEVRAR